MCLWKNAACEQGNESTNGVWGEIHSLYERSWACAHRRANAHSEDERGSESWACWALGLRAKPKSIRFTEDFWGLLGVRAKAQDEGGGAVS